jgi:hypothetical protein
VKRRIGFIAAGGPADSIAPAIRERESQIARLEVRLRAPRQVAPDSERLREALTQRAAEGRETSPLVLVDGSQNPNCVDDDFEVKPALLGGFQEGQEVASPAGTVDFYPLVGAARRAASPRIDGGKWGRAAAISSRGGSPPRDGKNVARTVTTASGVFRSPH